MHALLNTYSAEAISPYEFERAIEFHIEALERIDLTAVHRARRLTAEVVRAHFYDADEEFGDPMDAKAAIQELREFIDGLPAD